MTKSTSPEQLARTVSPRAARTKFVQLVDGWFLRSEGSFWLNIDNDIQVTIASTVKASSPLTSWADLLTRFNSVWQERTRSRYELAATCCRQVLHGMILDHDHDKTSTLTAHPKRGLLMTPEPWQRPGSLGLVLAVLETMDRYDSLLLMVLDFFRTKNRFFKLETTRTVIPLTRLPCTAPPPKKLEKISSKPPNQHHQS